MALSTQPDPSMQPLALCSTSSRHKSKWQTPQGSVCKSVCSFVEEWGQRRWDERVELCSQANDPDEFGNLSSFFISEITTFGQESQVWSDRQLLWTCRRCWEPREIYGIFVLYLEKTDRIGDPISGNRIKVKEIAPAFKDHVIYQIYHIQREDHMCPGCGWHFWVLSLILNTRQRQKSDFIKAPLSVLLPVPYKCPLPQTRVPTQGSTQVV